MSSTVKMLMLIICSLRSRYHHVNAVTMHRPLRKGIGSVDNVTNDTSSAGFKVHYYR